MFTGIIQAVGTIGQAVEIEGDLRLEIKTADLGLERIKQGDSIAVSGICLTVQKTTGQTIFVDVSAETIAITTVSDWRPGRRVNLEHALVVGDGLGGHLVSGHVDGVAVLRERRADARSERLEFSVPAEYSRFLVGKGSVTVDGVSLTINRASGNRFEVNLVPHTLQVTTLGSLVAGEYVNIEVDLLARYVDGILKHGRHLPE